MLKVQTVFRNRLILVRKKMTKKKNPQRMCVEKNKRGGGGGGGGGEREREREEISPAYIIQTSSIDSACRTELMTTLFVASSVTEYVQFMEWSMEYNRESLCCKMTHHIQFPLYVIKFFF